MELLLILVLAITAVYVIVNTTKQKMKDSGEQLDEALRQINELIHVVEIEEINGVHYWYDAVDREFLGQGSNTDAVIEVVKSRFPKHVFILPTMEVVSAPTWRPTSTGMIQVSD